MKRFFSFFFLVGLFMGPATARSESAAVIISEVAWMGMPNPDPNIGAVNEWIELYNPGAEPVSLDGWTLSAADGTPSITIESGKIIAAGWFFLLERKDDDSVPGVFADQFYAGALNNNPTGEHLILRNAAGTLVDEVNALGGWPAGDNTTKQTAERTQSLSWSTSTTAGGTPKTENSVWSESSVPAEPSPQPSPPPSSPPPPPEEIVEEPISSQNSSPLASLTASSLDVIKGDEVLFDGSASTDPDGDLLTYFWEFGDGTSQHGIQVRHRFIEAGAYTVTLTVAEDRVFGALKNAAAETIVVREPEYADTVALNELLPNPSGSDAENEFIELFNAGEETVDLSGWRLRDTHGAPRVWELPQGTSIKGLSYLALLKPKTGLLNNSEDGVELAKPNGAVSDSVSYRDAPEGSSWSRTEGGWAWSITPTPGKENMITETATLPRTEEPAFDAEEEKEKTAPPSIEPLGEQEQTAIFVPGENSADPQKNMDDLRALLNARNKNQSSPLESVLENSTTPNLGLEETPAAITRSAHTLALPLAAVVFVLGAASSVAALGLKKLVKKTGASRFHE